MISPLEILQQYWKHAAFRPLQEEIIQAVLKGKDCIALLPTGGGKSVCYQIPGILLPGVSLVISPLIALMKDQVDALNKKGITAVAIHSGMQKEEVKQVLLEATESAYQFIYCSPERLESPLFNEYLTHIPFSLLIIDEAHCISQWGYDFRPSYCRITETKGKLGSIPVIAVTASATPLVLTDIQIQLGLHEPSIFKQSFLRPNISYSCFEPESKINKILDILQKVQGSSIVYCNSRKQCKKIAEAILLQGISADFYHAGLNQLLREQKQLSWIQNKTRVMVCTNAFGMGIDKPDVRTVIHHDIPDCLENYYQEAGRAGRDEKRAYAVLLWQQKDLLELAQNGEKKFPPIPIIKEVYQAIADFLQIAVGNGEGIYYDFDFNNFITLFKLDPLLVVNVLRILEQEGHIQFNEQIFLPTQVNFCTDTESLDQFEIMYPSLEPLIKALLRTYAGIFYNRTSVYEQSLARICRTEIATISVQLKQLHTHGIIEYLPKKETPQIHFLLNRAPAEFLHIHQDHYLERKKLHKQRIATITQYAGLSKTCRSNFIGQYFGDNSTIVCGVCDICLNNKITDISAANFNQIELILKANSSSGIDIAVLISETKNISPKKVWAVLNFLQAEDKISITEEKRIFWL
ncbi:ATP-dependent DNA helicase RecQ [Sediminibacterium sp.]|uniref:RecQ family ATP-dependent DNA helicase n=1 Tax=Sediminibacterium sp. TaxID=1917865 RepID=UPI00273596E7|nr:ATP-dependent DNA helicase RecQ [Sediminibacterium sp.]MDP3393217.1 ATP-dependent DNA helicase RecQ [Sediminibacterium sp.]MDP3567819.1 ATP-dependent DNA helicase RecQ [Sediminibacterium sp.]